MPTGSRVLAPRPRARRARAGADRAHAARSRVRAHRRATVGADRLAAARRAAAELGATVLLKGNATVVARPGRLCVRQSDRHAVARHRRQRRRAQRADRVTARRRVSTRRSPRRAARTCTASPVSSPPPTARRVRTMCSTPSVPPCTLSRSGEDQPRRLVVGRSGNLPKSRSSVTGAHTMGQAQRGYPRIVDCAAGDAGCRHKPGPGLHVRRILGQQPQRW